MEVRRSQFAVAPARPASRSSRKSPAWRATPYAASFGRQWNRYDVMRPDEDEATFLVKTGVAAGELAGKLVLDAGCGGGRYAHLVGGRGARVIGVDLSAAVEKAAALCHDLPDVAIVQADLLDLPLAEGCFDLVYSIGVLHHTPDPRRAFAQIARRVKPGGRLAVWLYRRNTAPPGVGQHGAPGRHDATTVAGAGAPLRRPGDSR